MSDVPPGWVDAHLGELGNYWNGRGFKKSEWRDSGRPIIRIQNLTGSGKSYNHFQGDVDERHVARRGDLLVSWAATLGVFVWDGEEAVVNQHIFKVEPFIDARFHRYLIDHSLDQLQAKTHGSGMVHITRKRFEETPVLLPPLPEQRRIVEAIETHLSRIDAGVENLQRAQRNIERMRASILKAAVEGRLVPQDPNDEPAEKLLERVAAEREGLWNKVQAGRTGEEDGESKARSHLRRYNEPVAVADGLDLGELPRGWAWTTLDTLTYFTVDYRGKTPPSSDDGIPMISAANIKGGKVVPEPQRFVSEETYRKWTTRGLPEPGDLIITTEAPVGATAPYPEEGTHLLTRRVIALKTNGVVNLYLQLCFVHPDSYAHLKRHERGTTVPRILKPQLLATPVPVAPMDEQARIVREVERQMSILDALAMQLGSTESRAVAARRSVLRDAFAGRLAPQDPSDEPASALLDRIRAEREGATV